MPFDSQVQRKQLLFNALNATRNIVVTNAAGKQFTTLLPDGVLGPDTTAAFAAIDAQEPNWQATLPTPATCAVDSLVEASPALVNLAKGTIGKNPVWWGRYNSLWKHPDECGISVSEGSLLAQSSIPIQPIAANPARTGKIGGSLADGKAEAARDLHLLSLASQRAPTLIKRVFLDVEGKSNLTADFYLGWSQELAAAGWEPAVYMPNKKNFPAQWDALHAAIANGAPCVGTWSAWYAFGCQPSYLAAAWDARFAENDPAMDLAWQYLGDAYHGQLDFTMFKPGVAPWWEQ